MSHIFYRGWCYNPKHTEEQHHNAIERLQAGENQVDVLQHMGDLHSHY